MSGQPSDDIARTREIVRVALELCGGEDPAWDRWATLWLALEASPHDHPGDVVLAAARAFRRAAELYLPRRDPRIRRADARERTVAHALSRGGNPVEVEALLFDVHVRGRSRAPSLPEGSARP